MWRKEHRIGTFALERVIGYGELGIVYRAKNRATRETVAVKVLRPHLAGKTAVEELFLRSPIIASQIHHGNVVGIREMGTAAGRLYYAMEYVGGPPMQHVLHQDGMALKARLELLAAIARAAHHLHSRGVIHNDLKPSNILLTGAGEPKITDFEAATLRTQDGAEGAGGGALVCGTPPYMPPEALRGGRPVFDPRRDVYALGVIGYRMMTGMLPYVAPDLMALMRLKESEAPPMARWNPAVETRLDSTIRRAMMPVPAERWGSASDFARAVEGYIKSAKLGGAKTTTTVAAVKKHRLLSLTRLRRTIDRAACL
jgi:serine/threonine-protein kinase